MVEGEVSFVRTEGLLKGILALIVIVVLVYIASRALTTKYEESSREMKVSLANFRIKFKLLEEDEELTAKGIYLDKGHIFQFYGEEDDKPKGCIPALKTEDVHGCVCLCIKPESENAPTCVQGRDEVLQCYNLNYDTHKQTIDPKYSVTDTVPMNCKITFRDPSGIFKDKVYVDCEQ